MVVRAELRLVVVLVLDLDAVSVHEEELLDDAEKPTDVVVVSVSSRVVYKVIGLNLVASVCPGVGDPIGSFRKITRLLTSSATETTITITHGKISKLARVGHTVGNAQILEQ